MSDAGWRVRPELTLVIVPLLDLIDSCVVAMRCERVQPVEVRWRDGGPGRDWPGEESEPICFTARLESQVCVCAWCEASTLTQK